MQAPPVFEEEVQEMLEWLDSIPFSRPKKNMIRDFSDGFLVAEIMKQYYPLLVHMHNYPSTGSSSTKYLNWKTLNQKVFKKMGFQIIRNDIQNLINLVPGTVQRVLYLIYKRIQMTPNLPTIRNSRKVDRNITLDLNKQLSSELANRQNAIRELKDTIQVLQAKMIKMQQLSKLKDAKIDSLLKRIESQLIN